MTVKNFRPKAVAPRPAPNLEMIVNDFESARLADQPSMVLVGTLNRAMVAVARLATAIRDAALLEAKREAIAAKAKEPDRWLTVDEAADIARQSRKFFYSRAGSDLYPWVKRFGPRNIRVNEEGLRNWLRSQGQA